MIKKTKKVNHYYNVFDFNAEFKFFINIDVI